MYHVDSAVWFEDSLPDQCELLHRPLYYEYVLYIFDRKSQPAWSTCTRDQRACQYVPIDAQRTVLYTLRRCTGPNEVKCRKRRDRECCIYIYIYEAHIYMYGAHEMERPRCESNENGCKGWKGMQGRNVKRRKRNKDPNKRRR